MAKCPSNVEKHCSHNSSMTRNPRLEAFLKARYEYDTCEPEAKTRNEANVRSLAAGLVAVYHNERGQDLTLEDLFQVTADAYHEYRRAQVRLQRSRLDRPR